MNPQLPAVSRPHTRRLFLKTIGAAAAATPFITRGLLANPPSGKIRHAAFGADGMAWQDLVQIASCDDVEIVAICDVDTDRMAKAKEQFPKARFYQDWRRLLDAEARNIDSVNVSTPDHMHAPIAVSAMQLGKHVYGEKPLAHNLHETRRMTEIAREKKLVTQMGIQIHSNAHYRMGVQLIQDGAIGKIREVHSWCYKTWGDDTGLPDRADPVPAGFDWDLWLGVAEARPYIGDKYYHPGNWRKRLDFGTATLGDMACHIFDPVFEALGLTAPLAVRSEGNPPNRVNWALNGKVAYTYAGPPRTAGKTLSHTWYDGIHRPPADILALVETTAGKPLPSNGSIFVGEKGAMLLPHYERPSLYPSVEYKDYKRPSVRGLNHWKLFVEACRGNGRTNADFEYSGPLTEAVLLGGVAARFPKANLAWDSKKLRFDLREANKYVRRAYRKGWRVPGL